MYVNIDVTMATEFWRPCFSKFAFSLKNSFICFFLLLIELLRYLLLFFSCQVLMPRRLQSAHRKVSKPMHSNLTDEDRSVKVRGIIRSASVLCLWATKTSKKSLVKPQKRNTILCCRECRYRLIVRTSYRGRWTLFQPLLSTLET